MRLLLLGLILGLVGCQHTHLRHNTVHQAKTLAEIYEQQVLDNLAKTVHDAHALPFFAYPKDGSTNITDSANITATPFRNFTNVFGINGTRSGLEQWGLTPVSDPAKLQLMQCAYQRAVYGHPMSECSECCEREKEFEGKPDVKLKVWGEKEPEDKSDLLLNGGERKGRIFGALCNPATGKLYNVQPSGTGHVYIDDDENSYIVDEAGYVTIPQYDCDGPCAVNCGWLSYGKRCDVPRDCCSLIGYHCGTYVWVPHCHRQHLSRLTLKILDYAVNDPPIFLKRQKEVEVSVDKFGQFTTDENLKVGTVKAVIAIDEPISSVLVVDNCALERAGGKARKTAAKAVEDALRQLDLRPETVDDLSKRWMDGTLKFSEREISKLLEPYELTDEETAALSKIIASQSANGEKEQAISDSSTLKLSNPQAKNVYTAIRLLEQTQSAMASGISDTASSSAPEPSPYVIPKRPAYNPGDGYLNPFRLQRELNALGNTP